MESHDHTCPKGTWHIEEKFFFGAGLTKTIVELNFREFVLFEYKERKSLSLICYLHAIGFYKKEI